VDKDHTPQAAEKTTERRQGDAAELTSGQGQGRFECLSRNQPQIPIGKEPGQLRVVIKTEALTRFYENGAEKKEVQP